MKSIFKILSGSMILTIAILAMVMFILSCKSLTVYTEDEIPECNDYYTTLDSYLKSENKDNAFPAIIYQECMKGRQQKRQHEKEVHCREMYFGKDGIDKKNYERYSQYLECVK